MMSSTGKLDKFISEEKELFDSLKTGIDWYGTDWDCSNWLFHRGSSHSLPFRELGKIGKRISSPLPLPYMNFCKATVAYLQRTKGIGFVAIHKYLIECRRLFMVLKERGESSPVSITRWHFENTLEILRNARYKNYYDASASLRVIAEVIDKNEISENLLDFNPESKPTGSRHEYTPVSQIDTDESRKDDEKLPSYEAMAAYAKSTNEPINDDEEILLRTIDLLIAMGQRANEVALIPLDCWVEKEHKSRTGELVKDSHGRPIIKTGIRYFAEKKAIDKVHWLADQDIQFAKRAVDRLVILTAKTRKTAEWQEKNPGRLWNIDPEAIIPDNIILKSISFASFYNLHLFLERNGILPVNQDYDHDRINESGPERYFKRHFYRAGKVESLIMSKFFKGHDQLKIRTGNTLKVKLTTSEVLPIACKGAFQFKERGSHKIVIIPCRVTLRDINVALGAVDGLESIFERRKLKEADGSKIVLTSHQPRHWRNTLYELAGMTNVQQALALGRQRLDQNTTYQHTSLLERTQAHRDYLTFKNPKEKIQFLHDGIREKKILGEITRIYHELKSNKGKEIAETFLKTHAVAIHVTPFGGCTHDFSQAPCPKHMQCWNGCGHLHRTNTPGESERIQEQISLSKVTLNSMKADAEGEYGANVWVKDLETKIDNMQKALDIQPVEAPIKIFPNGEQFTIAFEDRKGSSVSD